MIGIFKWKTGDCCSGGISVYLQPVSGAQGVHEGSVWTNAVLRECMQRLKVVVALRSIDPQEMLVS